ncbi:MAG TPA: hypothetical protein VMG36_05725 [Thermoplasmata archaeon]|nr:hypothetical protein [Thermoplasmata archaeon]
MSAPRPSTATDPSDLLATGLLGAAAVFLALFSVLPLVLALAVALGGVAAAAAARRLGGPASGVAAGLPALAALGLLACTAPTTAAAELAAGTGALAFLLWLAASPKVRAAGALRRAIPTIALAALILVLAWSSELLLPHVPAVLGIGGLLLVAVVVTIAVLVGRPELIDREPEATS